MFRLKFLFGVVVALCAQSQSQAAFTLTVQQGPSAAQSITLNLESLTTTPTTVSGSAGGVAYSYTAAYDASVQGFRISTFTFGQYNFFSTITSSITGANNLPGDTIASLAFNATDIRRTGTGAAPDFKISLTAAGFDSPTGLVNAHTVMSGNFVTSATQGVVTLTSEVTGLSPNAQLVVGNGTPRVNSGNLDKISAPFVAVAPYSITQTISVSGMGSGAGQRWQSTGLSVDIQAVATPAPAGLVMLATALPFAGLLRRRFRKSEVATAA